MITTAAMHTDALELGRRALIADLGATLGEHSGFQDHAQRVSSSMPEVLAWTIHHRGWMVEPLGDDLALELARRYGNGQRRQRIVAVFLREAAAALQFVPPEFEDPHAWATLMLMNVGSIAHTPKGQAAGVSRRPSSGARRGRELGCQAIARRGSGQCIVCGRSLQLVPVSGAVQNRDHRPLLCSEHGEAEKHRHTDAMLRVYDRCEWLLAEAMPLQIANRWL